MFANEILRALSICIESQLPPVRLYKVLVLSFGAKHDILRFTLVCDWKMSLVTHQRWIPD